MIYKVFSDMHLSDSLYSGGKITYASKRDDFAPHAEAFMECYHARVNKDDGLILAGDTFELLQVSANDILTGYFTLLYSIFNVPSKIIILMGNHDPYAKDIQKIINRFPSEIRDKTSVMRDFKPCNSIMVMHGDQFDETVSKNKKLAYFVTSLGGFFEKISPGIDIWFNKYLDKLRGIGKHSSDAAGYVKEIASYCKKEGIVKYIYGHTHKVNIVHMDNGVHIHNDGCWVNKKNYGYVTIDTDTFKVETCLWV